MRSQLLIGKVKVGYFLTCLRPESKLNYEESAVSVGGNEFSKVITTSLNSMVTFSHAPTRVKAKS